MSGREQARRFLQALYGRRRGIAYLALGQHPHRAEGGKYGHKAWKEEPCAWPDQADALVARAIGAAGNADVYVSVLLRSSRSRKAETALPGRWIWADLDNPPRDEELLARLLERDGMVVRSGSPGHQQVYIRLSEDAPVAVLSDLSKRLKVALGGDHKHDAAAVLRLPGTLNHKARVAGDEATPVVLATGDLNGDPGWSLVDLDAELPHPQPPARLSADGSGGVWDGRLPAHVRRLLAEEPGDDRSGQTAALVGACVEWGIPDDAIRDLAGDHAPSVAKYDGRVTVEVDRLLDKLRPHHLHVGRPCDRAGCPNAPHWMSGSPALPLAADGTDGLPPEPRRRRAESALSAESPPSTEPYRAAEEWPAPMAAEAFHGLAGEFVRQVEPHTEADQAALLVDLLGLVGHTIGRTAHVRVGPVNHYPNLYAVVVGPSGAAGRKGTAYAEPRRLLDRAAPDAAARIVGGAASGEGIIWNVRDAIYGRDKKTGAEVETDAGVEDKRLLLREAEFSQVLRVAGRDSNTLSVVLREAWDSGDRLQTLAKNSPTKATGAHVSLLADITPNELRRELTATDRANGFANRILWCCSRRSKELPDGGHVDREALERLAARLGGALAGAHLFGPVGRDEAARDLWHEIYGRLTRERPGLLGALLARAEAQVVRLSLVYAVLDGAQTIGRAHLEAALAVWDYCERSARFIFGDALGDPTADELLDALRRTSAGLTRNEMRDYFGRHRSSAEIGRALGLLERQGLARCEREQTGGRPAERWYAVRTEGRSA